MMHLSPASAAHLGIRTPKRSKYGAVRTNGFASKKESRRWLELRCLEKAGEISELRAQPEFHCWIHGQLVCRYIADASWVDRAGVVHVEDTKGLRLPVFRLKAKLVAALFGVTVEIV